MDVMAKVLITLLLLAALVYPQSKVGGTATIGGTAKAGVQTATASDFVTDSLDGTNGTDLKDHSPSVGSTWIDHPHANYTSPFIFESNRVYASGGTAAYYNDATPPSADYYVQADVYAASIISANAGPAGRIDTTADTMYLCRSNSGTSYDLRKIVSGTSTTLGTSSNQQPSAGQTKTVKLVMTGNQISCYVNGTLEIGPITDSDITAAGRAGIRSTVMTSTTGFHIDNFSAR